MEGFLLELPKITKIQNLKGHMQEPVIIGKSAAIKNLLAFIKKCEVWFKYSGEWAKKECQDLEAKVSIFDSDIKESFFI